MAPETQRAAKPRHRGRTTILAGLLAIIAVIAMWLSDCIPGFGLGSRSQEGEAEQEAEPEPAKPAEPEPDAADKPEPGSTARKPMPMKLTVDARGCTVGGDEHVFDCATLCDRTELFEGRDSVIIDAKHGPHAVVVELLDCLKSKKLAVSITRK